VLSLPEVSVREGTEYSVPPTLSMRESRGELTILRTEQDFGPGTKILGPVDAIADDDIVIILDDDNWYEPFTV
jgi:hypothetical protein